MIDAPPDHRSRIVADVARAADVVAPMWPLTSFVAVNPLGGLEHVPFELATAEAAGLFGARTHLPLATYRRAHAAGAISDLDLRHAIVRSATFLCAQSPITVGGRTVDIEDVLHTDLVGGPDAEPPAGVTVANAAAVDYVAAWCSTFVSDAAWSMPDRDLGLFAAWHRLAAGDRRLRRLVGRDGQRWIATLPDDATGALGAAIDALGVTDEARVDALRTLLLRTPGWAGHARWVDNWSDDDGGPRLRTVDLVALHAVVAAAAGETAGSWPHPASVTDDAPELLERRARHVAEVFADGPADAASVEAVAAVLERVPSHLRSTIWLQAHELHVRDELLARLAHPDPGVSAERPDAQVVMCIDVRSEGFRRHLEGQGAYETFGFAGFFGVPVKWRSLGSDHAEARCPVLVTPSLVVEERAVDDATGLLARRASADGAATAYHRAKQGWGAPFALAESAGWITGPLAAARTLFPRRRRRAAVRTAPAVDAATAALGGLTLDERTLFAEAIVSTIGMRRFAPLVVLCGHGAHTVNNPHASSLDCGACGGAPGGASARIAAAILNDAEVREQLTGRGVVVPADTWFVAAEHDTPSDRVEILDAELVPAEHADALSALVADLAAAGSLQAAERALRLPGADAESVRSRGDDWAQVRPEWGLAGNAAFIAAPRSATAGVDLAGRTFLHSYDAELDPDGTALETIMTAPLVVAQWISSQYYFSTVDPDRFGAGDKMIHNPIGGVGVLRGRGGDLATGLPVQSVSDGETLAHEPLRLLAMIQAPLDRIEEIIGRNPGLRRLVDGAWIQLAARGGAHEPWSVRSAPGTWETWHPVEAPADDLTPLALAV